jgi:hypothetical protein
MLNIVDEFTHECPAFIAPGRPWENGYVESFNARLRDALLNGEIFLSRAEAKIIIERWQRHFNTIYPHGSLGYRPAAPEILIPASPSLRSPALVGAAPTTGDKLAPKPSIHEHSNWATQWGPITPRFGSV